MGDVLSVIAQDMLINMDQNCVVIADINTQTIFKILSHFSQLYKLFVKELNNEKNSAGD
jgi:hypothetical protein